MIYCSESFTKITILEGEEVTIFVVLSLVGKEDDGRLNLFIAYIVGMFKICFDVIAKASQVNKVPVIFGDVYRYFI